jgi:tetratricopeptide (TPR) repeat protein
VAKPSTSSVSDADKRKSDMIFLEANRCHALGNEDAYYALLKRAYELNPDDHTTGYYYGFYDFLLSGGDSVRFTRNYDLMKRHVDNAPGDYYPASTFGAINDRMGRTDESLKVWSTLDSLYPNKLDTGLQYADALVKSGDSANVARAIDVYNRIELSQGKSIPLSTRKIRTYLFNSQDTAATFAEVKALLASSPTSPENNVFAGDVYSLLSKNDSALAYYNRACELDPSSGLAYYSRANFYKSIDDSVAYDREVFQALKMESLDLDTKLEIMTNYVRELYSDTLQQPRIRELFESLIEQHPHEVNVHDLYGSYLVAIQDYPAAAEQMGYSIDIDPSDEQKWCSYVNLYFHADDYNSAVDVATRGLGYHTSSADLTFLRGISFSQLKKYDEALADMEQSLVLADSGNVEFVCNVLGSEGDIYSNTGQKDKAEELYQQALALNPDYMLVLNNYAYMLAVEGRDLERAERMSYRTIQARPEDINSLDTYAWILFRQKRYTEALLYIKKALDLSPEPAYELYSHAGDIFFWNGEQDKAVEYWETALSLSPDDQLLKRKVTHKTYFFE